MHYLVTGGAGFIGSHLAEHLARQGHAVTVIDIVTRPSLSYTSIVGSVLDYPRLNSLIREHDACFHMAAIVGFAKVMQYPTATITTSLDGTTNVLRASLAYGKRVLFTSTSAVYGRTTDEDRPVHERDPVRLGPPSVRSWCYAYAKAAEECLALAYHQEHHLPVIITRLFNVVGARQSADAGFVLPRFVEAAIADQPLHVHAPGTQSRTFGHVQDVVEGLTQLMECDEAVGEIVNIGGTETVGMYALAERIRNSLESSSVIEIIPDPYGGPGRYENVQHRRPDLTKAHRLIGYTPTRDLDAMIADVLEDCEARV